MRKERTITDLKELIKRLHTHEWTQVELDIKMSDHVIVDGIAWRSVLKYLKRVVELDDLDKVDPEPTLGDLCLDVRMEQVSIFIAKDMLAKETGSDIDKYEALIGMIKKSEERVEFLRKEIRNHEKPM